MGAKLYGKRIFGDNKTIRGTASSLICGIAVGLIEYPFLHYMLPVAILLAVGANVGDLLGSFIKRRLNVTHGASFPLLDQYGFFVFALLFALPLGHYMLTIYGVIFLIVLTGLAHVFTNRGAHKLRLKKVPW